MNRISQPAIWIVAGALALTSAAPSVLAGPVRVTSNANLLKVFRVFGDDDSSEAGTGARTARRTRWGKSRKRGRTRSRVAPSTPVVDAEPGILDLIDPCAMQSVSPVAQKNVQRAQNPLRGGPSPCAQPGQEPCR